MTAASPPTATTFPRSGIIFPAIGILFYAATALFGLDQASALSVPGALYLLALVVVMFGTVFATVHHAEEIAHRVGEPFGTLVLTLSVTAIEAALILTLMLGENGESTLARDTVFSVIMIVCNGLVGLCILLGGLQHREQEFRVPSANAYLSVIATLSILTLVLPNYTVTTPGPVFSPSQLVFESIVTVALFVVFLYIQTIRHTEYFVHGADSTGAATIEGEIPDYAPLQAEGAGRSPDPLEQPQPVLHPPGNPSLRWTSVLLIVSLVVVIMLAKTFGHGVEEIVRKMGAPAAVTGLVVALLVLLPESMAAVRAAYRDQLQKSLNLALGSSLATIGLTIPAVAAVALFYDKQLVLGLDPEETLLLILTLIVSVFTFATGRTNVLPGFIHLVIFAAYVFLTYVP